MSANQVSQEMVNQFLVFFKLNLPILFEKFQDLDFPCRYFLNRWIPSFLLNLDSDEQRLQFLVVNEIVSSVKSKAPSHFVILKLILGLLKTMEPQLLQLSSQEELTSFLMGDSKGSLSLHLKSNMEELVTHFKSIKVRECLFLRIVKKLTGRNGNLKPVFYSVFDMSPSQREEEMTRKRREEEEE